VAVRRSNNKKQNNSGVPQAVVIFWLVFFIVIVSIFLANRNTIFENFDLLKTRITTSPDRFNPPPVITDPEPEIVIQPVVVPPTAQPVTPPTTPQPATPPVSQPQTTTSEPAKTPVQDKQPTSAQTRDRNIYFTQIDRDGQILRSKVNRKIAVSSSPLQDALNVMLAGPSADELNRGIISFIPQKTRLISAIVRGTTAYLNFSEDFQFNTFGVEGYAAQLRQIIWTATEFPTVKDVQILIEGRRVDYLGEGIWIGSPLDRQAL
jgi:spore germination protein GerM